MFGVFGMTQLRGKAAKFVEHYVRTGKKRDSAIAAGYAPVGAAVSANRLLKRPSVWAAVEALFQQRRAQTGPAAWAGIQAIAEDRDAPPGVRLMAWRDLADRAGLGAVHKSEHTVIDTRTADEMRAELRALMAEAVGLGALIDVTPSALGDADRCIEAPNSLNRLANGGDALPVANVPANTDDGKDQK